MTTMDVNQKTLVSRFFGLLQSKLLIVLTILGIICGFALGFGVRLVHPSQDALMWMELPGEVFLNLLKMPIIPLIISSIITATASMDPKKNGKLGLIFLILHIATNAFGSGMGIILGIAIRPGRGLGNETTEMSTTTAKAPMQTQDIAADMIRNLFPGNLVRATFQKVLTKYETVENVIYMNTSDGVSSQVVTETSKHVAYVDAMNIIGLIFCCVVFGLAAGQAKEKGKPMLDFFESATQVIMIVLQWFLWVAPIGIMSLIAASIASIDDLSSMFIKLSLFVAAVLTGLVIHQAIVMPVIYFVITRKNPFKVFMVNLKAWFVSFASASSAGAMPYLYESCKKLNIDERVTSFGVPLAVTLNATGSSLFCCCAVVFLAQINQIALNVGQLLTLFTLTSASTMALPSMPSASILLIVILCSTFSVPVESIGLLFAVEWFLDRIRTTSNVTSEIFILAMSWHFIHKDFETSNGDDDITIEIENTDENSILNSEYKQQRKDSGVSSAETLF